MGQPSTCLCAAPLPLRSTLVGRLASTQVLGRRLEEGRAPTPRPRPRKRRVDTQEGSSLRGLLGRKEEPRRAISESWKYQGCFSSPSLPNNRRPSQLVIRLRHRNLGPAQVLSRWDLIWLFSGERQASTTLLPPNCGTTMPPLVNRLPTLGSQASQAETV